MEVRHRPCATCPYRQNVPSGVWAAEEYAKLPPYDGDTPYQPQQVFMCHQSDGKMCAGWVGCGGRADQLLSLRIAVATERVSEDVFDYESPVPLFPTHTAAALHGLAHLTDPDDRAQDAIDKLMRQGKGSS